MSIKDGKPIYADKTLVGTSAYATPVFTADMKTDRLQPRLDRAADGRHRKTSPRRYAMGASRSCRIHKLSVSYQGTPVDASKVDWGRVNVLNYTFSQKGGPENVLGKVKFLFPNRHTVYMHDTLPVRKKFFQKASRAIGHECVRMEKPERFAEVLLAEDKGWSASQVKELWDNGVNKPVTIDRKIPVHMVYFTAVADETGKVATFADLYGLDNKMATALFGRRRGLPHSAAGYHGADGGGERVRLHARAAHRAAAAAISPTRSADLPATRSERRRETSRFARGIGNLFQDRAGELGQGRVARAHDQHEVAGSRLLGDARDEPCARGRELGLAPAAGDLGHDVGGGEVARSRCRRRRTPPASTAGRRPQLAGESGDEVLAQEARRAVAMRLVDGEHAACRRDARGLERGGDLVGVVGEIVDHLDAAGGADGLEPPPHALEARERRRHLGKRHAERAAGGDRGERVRDIVRARHRQREGHVRPRESGCRFGRAPHPRREYRRER